MRVRLAPKLRELQQRGWAGRVRPLVYTPMLKGYSSWYWSRATDLFTTPYEWDAACDLHARYQRFYHYCTDVEPEWKVIGKIMWMDNSVSVIEESKYGERRERMIEAPKGDICF